MTPDTGPRWYETPLWFVAQIPVYMAVAWVLDRILPDDLGRAGGFSSLTAFLITLWVAVAIRARLRRRDA